MSAKPAEWKAYETEVATFFRGLGLDVETAATVHGVRTAHVIDVMVRFERAGLGGFWIAECKSWKTRVSKLHVLALRQIVTDSGADRGLLMAENGYHRGAHEAAATANVWVTSLDELRQRAAPEVAHQQMRVLLARLARCESLYWSMDKEHRIGHGLRPEFGESSYRATGVIEASRQAVSAGLADLFPYRGESMYDLTDPSGPIEGADAVELVTQVEPRVADLEAKIDHALRSVGSAS